MFPVEQLVDMLKKKKKKNVNNVINTCLQQCLKLLLNFEKSDILVLCTCDLIYVAEDVSDIWEGQQKEKIQCHFNCQLHFNK